MAEETKRYHAYFAQATAFSGSLQLPVESGIEPQGTVVLEGERGGYLAKQDDEGFRLQSAISYRAAYTQVAGNPDPKPGHGWSTLATSVVEGLNIFDVVTADRIVAQINTDHPLSGYVPTVTFLGTRFENLRIAGHPVAVDLDIHLLGRKPEQDAPYTRSTGFLERVARQHDCIRAESTLPPEILERYNQVPSSDESRRGVECSLVNSVTPSERHFPGRTCGHAIEVPHFGVIYLATLSLLQADFNPDTGIPETTGLELTMLDVRMGCLAAGTAVAGQAIIKGTTHP